MTGLSAPMPWWRLLSTIAAAGLLAAGCGDDSDDGVSPEDTPPSNLAVVNGDGQVTLVWDAAVDARLAAFESYNIYRAPSSMVGMALDDLVEYVVGTRLFDDGTEFTDTGVTNGNRYFYAVRAVDSNGSVSAPSNEIDVAPRPDGGPVALFEFDSKGTSGLGLSEGASFAMSSSSPDNRPMIDLYLGTTDENDLPTDPLDESTVYSLALKSPSLVLNGSPAWAERSASIKVLLSFDEPTTTDDNWTDQIILDPADLPKVFAVRTPLEEGQYHYGKVEVTGISGDPGSRQVQLNWAYQTLPDYISF